MGKPCSGASRDARFARVFERHVEDVRRYLYACSPAAVADEIVADVFLVVWRRLDDVPLDSLPWLLGVARRCRLAAERSEHRQRAVASRLAAEPADPLAAPLGDRALGAALATLSEADRELLLLVAWDGVDAGQAAGVLGLRRGSVYMRLHRARRRLAAALAAQELGATSLPPAVTRVRS
jgi:RNA polymerase sigma-70 factor (ECF subfamily)